MEEIRSSSVEMYLHDTTSLLRGIIGVVRLTPLDGDEAWKGETKGNAKSKKM